MKKNKLIVVLGPTASGKTKLAVKLARKFKGEIVSADSRQVYQGMDIGTGKDLKEYEKLRHGTAKKVSYHLIDVADPRASFNIARYQILALKAINDIRERGKVPIICGGSGLYISAIVDGLVLPRLIISKDEEIKLRARLDNLSLEDLLEELKKVDLKTYRTIDKKNRRRVQRALEIFYQTGKPKSVQQKKKAIEDDVLMLGVKIEKQNLHKKIEKRMHQWFRAGLVEEVNKLHNDIGVSWSRLREFGLEYRWISEFIQQKVSEKEMKENIIRDIKNFAKRQMTWFRRDQRIKWIQGYKQAEEKVKKFLS